MSNQSAVAPISKNPYDYRHRKILEKPMKKFLSLIIILALAVCGFYVYKHKQADENSAALALVLKQTRGTVVVEREFPAMANLVGFLVHFKNSPTNQAIIYADKRGRYLLMGDIINAKGNNITVEATQKLIHDPLIDEAYYNLKDTHSIYQGKPDAKHLISILIDPNSSLFPLQYQNLITYIDKGDLAVRWILVSYLKPYNDTRAAAILQSKNPVAALALNAKNYNYNSETGGVAPIKHVKAKTKKELVDNWNFMQKYKFSATPVIFMKTDTGKIYVMGGFLMDEMLGNVIKSVTGPKQSSDNG